MTTTVLWPDDIRGAGFVFGWRTPVVCVGGLLDAPTPAHASLVLERLCRTAGSAAVAHIFGAHPAVLARCVVRAGGTPELEFLDACPTGGACRLVRYRRPNLRRMQLYTLDDQLRLFKAARPGRKQEDFSASIAVDPTRLHIPQGSVFGPETVRQMNYGQLLGQPLPQRVTAESRPDDSIVRSWHSRLGAISALAGQICSRLTELHALPREYPRLTLVVSTPLISQYVTFYNYIWLVLNDIIIGWAVGAVVCEHSQVIASFLDTSIRTLLIDNLQWALVWLNNWPAGLKLNSELSQFFCHLLLGAVIGWNRALESFLLPYLPQLIYTAGTIGCCGVTLTISLFSDLLSVTTAHVQLCYHISRLVYRQQLNIAGSLWHIFRGKRYNVLRHRVDSWSYDLDQLLFGTILFTLTAFIFPTTFTYYLLFATIQLATFLGLALMNVALVLVNQFPLFALLLRVKDPARLPAGIVFKLDSRGGEPCIQNKPLSVSAIFAHYRTFWSSFMETHNPIRLLGNIMTGKVMLSTK